MISHCTNWVSGQEFFGFFLAKIIAFDQPANWEIFCDFPTNYSRCVGWIIFGDFFELWVVRARTLEGASASSRLPHGGI